MGRRILKYIIPLGLDEYGPFFVTVSTVSRLLWIGLDAAGSPCMWFEVDPDLLDTNRTFNRVGTGQELPSDVLNYMGSHAAGPFVWHYYETTEPHDG